MKKIIIIMNFLGLAPKEILMLTVLACFVIILPKMLKDISLKNEASVHWAYVTSTCAVV